MKMLLAETLVSGLVSGRITPDRGAGLFKQLNKPIPRAEVQAAVDEACSAGFLPGTTVVIYGCPGVVVGLNTSDRGFYNGACCPVIVAWKNGVFSYPVSVRPG